MTPEPVIVQMHLDWPESVKRAVGEGDYLGALDKLSSLGAVFPADLLMAASAKVTAEGNAAYKYEVMQYKGRIRVVATKRTATEPADI
jgi:hypothetical protein